MIADEDLPVLEPYAGSGRRGDDEAAPGREPRNPLLRGKWRWAGPDVPAEAGGGVKPLVDAATQALELLEGGADWKVREVIEALRKALGEDAR